MDIKIGDKVRYIGPATFCNDMTHGKVYDVADVGYGCAEVLDDVGDYNTIRLRDCEPVTDTQQAPTLWRDMTDAERGALLLAHHDERAIEWCWEGNAEWQQIQDPIFSPCHAYRIKPEPKKPREWWIVGGCEAWDSEADAVNSTKALRHSDVVHVREVLDD